MLFAACVPDILQLLDVELQTLAPSSLQEGPEALYRVELAAVRRQVHQLEVLVVDVLKLFREVDPQVVVHDYDSLALALLLEADQEVLEVVRVVVLIDDMIVDQPLLLADGADDGDRVPTVIHHLKLNSRADPAAPHLLP